MNKNLKKILKALRTNRTLQGVIIFLLGKRQKYANLYIQGQGIEIGALHSPLKISPKRASIVYVDRMDNRQLRKHYPELKLQDFVKVGIVDDGEKLEKIDDASQNFVIANHFIEHCEDPLITLQNNLRVLKKDGVIYWSVPNKIYTFDKQRPITSIGHLWQDHLKGLRFSRKKHYQQWVRYVLDLSGKKADKKVKELIKTKSSIHYHVWTPDSFRKFLNFAKKKLSLRFKIIEITTNLAEFIVILKKY